MATDDKMKRIALETVDDFAQRIDGKLSELHSRVTALASDVSAIKTRVQSLPDKSTLLKEIETCRVKHEISARLSPVQWFKIITLILGFLAAAWGVDFAIPNLP